MMNYLMSDTFLSDHKKNNHYNTYHEKNKQNEKLATAVFYMVKTARCN